MVIPDKDQECPWEVAFKIMRAGETAGKDVPSMHELLGFSESRKRNNVSH